MNGLYANNFENGHRAMQFVSVVAAVGAWISVDFLQTIKLPSADTANR